MRPLVVVMGVTGSGKSTVGAALARRLGVPFAEADDFHTPRNVAKMAAGTPLDDEDRQPWLAAIASWLAQHAHTGGLVTCSTLRRVYRDQLREEASMVIFVHLHGSPELIEERLRGRQGHFMPVSLLRSQYDALETLAADERGATVSIDGSVDEVTERALATLGSYAA